MNRPDIILKSGRVIKHSLMPNGATNAAPADGGEFDEAEWQEYCAKLLREVANPNADVVQAFPKGRYPTV